MTSPGRVRENAPPINAATPEAELVDAARPGSNAVRREAAVRELVRRLNPRLFRVARGVVASDAEAEDVVQESYLAAFGKLDQFRRDSAFSTWITRIAINNARMHQRNARPQESYDTVTENHDTPANVVSFPGIGSDRPEAELGRAQIRALMEHAVAALPSDMRLAFLMHEVEGLSIRRIAADLSLNPVTVKTRLFRARRRLRTALEAEMRGGFDMVFPFDGARCAGMADRVVDGLRTTGRL
ncbi:MAG: RNA polymerase sigma factor [Roseovarius sp.]|nr:RNA polymerase sigma factor [Roseovarius sp.]